MAYDGTKLDDVDNIIGGAQREWWYRTTDAASLVVGTSYFSDGVARGMKVGDIVMVFKTDTNNLYEMRVSAVTTTACTVLPLDWFNLGLTGLFTESSADALTALTGGQAGALALTKEINRFTTVTAGFGASLPPAAPGLTIVVINNGVGALQVYGAGTDTINDVATATGVAQMPGSVVFYACTVAGKWYSEGVGTGYSGSLPTLSFLDNVTAHAGGTQALAFALTAAINRVATVGSVADSVRLPASAPGLAIIVINSSSTSMQVFGAGTDTINGVATATGVPQAGNSVLTYTCTVAGNWVVGNIPHVAQAQVSVIATTGVVTLTGAQAAGSNDVTVDLTGQTGSQATNTPTAAQIVAAIPNAFVGQTYRFRIIQRAAFTLTLTAGAGVTVNGTATVAQGICREYLVTLVSLTAVTFASLYAYTVTAA